MLALIAGALSLNAAAPRPLEPTIGDFLTDPLGMNLENISFSWKLPESEGAYQKAYRVAVATSPEALEDFPDVWDSGKVDNCRSVHTPYGGRKPKSGEKLFWRVKYWDKDGVESAWSNISSFEAGLQDAEDWKGAKWLKTSVGKMFVKDRIMPCIFRKEFEIKHRPLKTRLYIASKGVFEARINGKKVGDDFWGTGWTDYRKRVQSSTYDLTGVVTRGKNAIAITLADGWFAGSMSSNNRESFYGLRPEFIAKLVITFTDGTEEVILTDATWKCEKSAVLAADIYDGESYDARLAEKLEGYDKPKFDDSKWLDADIANENPFHVKIDPRRDTPIRQFEELTPVSMTEPQKGVFVFDMGQNMVGSIAMRMAAPRNTTLKIRYAEMLNKDGTLYTANYRSADSTDYYIFRGSWLFPEKWTPVLTFHGFRYVEFSGLPEGMTPDLSSVTGLVWHNDMKPTGSFECSDPLLNKLQSNIVWGQKGNFFSVPTDCPQRDERLGWTGDAQVFAPTAAFNMDVSAFFSKWMVDLRDAQNANGAYSDTAPAIGLGHGRAAWADAGVIIPWTMYQAYGDRYALESNYEAMKKYIEFQKNDSPGLIRTKVGYGDWLQPYAPNPGGGNTPKELIGTAYFAHTACIMSKIATILGRKDDADYFKKLSQEVKDAFVKTFVKSDGVIGEDSQTGYLLALAFDILPEDKRATATAKLMAAIDKADGHLRTGFVGTPLINPVLSKVGKTDAAYGILLKETYPGWLFSIHQGATTMWERWNSYTHADGFGDAGMNSFNHYAYGAIGLWMYEKIGGLSISCGPSKPAYKETVFAPELGGGISYAKVSKETPYGLVQSAWEIEDNTMLWEIIIAPNTKGKIVFPTSKIGSILIGGEALEDFAKRTGAEISECGGRPVLSKVPAGEFEIEFEL